MCPFGIPRRPDATKGMLPICQVLGSCLSNKLFMALCNRFARFSSTESPARLAKLFSVSSSEALQTQCNKASESWRLIAFALLFFRIGGAELRHPSLKF